MALHYLRRLTGRERTPAGNLQLARLLAFVAGAINAGGFLAVQQYTSHMSGIVSSVADELVLGEITLALAALGVLISFISGAACTALMVNWARRQHLHSEYALPLMLEALLLLGFGLLGGNLDRVRWLFAPAAVTLLGFLMGLQNAIITKISHAEMRTTHVTGLVTDIGIELGKLMYLNGRSSGNAAHPPVRADRAKLWMLTSLVGLFLLGGLVGALGFKYVGFGFAVPLAALLVVLATVPVLDDFSMRMRRN